MSHLRIGLMAIALAALSACGGSSDDATKFAGSWTFASGELVAACGQAFTAPAPFQLAGLGVTVARVNNSAFDLSAGTGTKCTIHFNVSGSKATAAAGQTCILDVGELGEQTLAISSWTLELSGELLTSTTSAIVVVCSLNGSGVLVRSTTDGGAPDARADAAADVKLDTAKPDTAKPDTATDPGLDAGAETSADAGGDETAEAGSDATAD